MSAPPSDPFPRENSIGFLRLLLSGLVLFSHAWFLSKLGPCPLRSLGEGRVSFGNLAVHAFFVLSGCLVARSWLRSPGLLGFIRNRALRLGPALWVCLAVTAFVFTPIHHLARPAEGVTLAGLLPEAAGYVWRNLLQPRTQIAVGPYPGSIPWSGDWNGSLWTLFYEGSAYLLVAALGLLGLLSRRRALASCLFLGVLVLGSVWALQPSLLPAPLPRLFDTSGKRAILAFVSGVFWALHPGLNRLVLRPGVGPLCAGLLVAGLAFGVHAALAHWILAPVLFWLAQVLPFQDFEKRVGGDYSYGLYLYGYPVQQLLALFGAYHLGFTAYFLLSLLFASACAVLSWRFVERPALGWKKSRAAVAHRLPPLAA